MFAHDYAPNEYIRNILSNIFDSINYIYVVISGYIGAALTVIVYRKVKQFWYLVLGFISFAISFFFYGLYNSNMAGM